MIKTSTVLFLLGVVLCEYALIRSVRADAEGVVSQLRDPTLVLRIASVKRLARRLERFIRKPGPAINTLLERL